MVLTFDRKVMPDDMSMVPEGFSIADESGKYYKAYAAFPLTKDVGIWNTANKSCDTTKVHVWSPLVELTRSRHLKFRRELEASLAVFSHGATPVVPAGV